jgi:MgtC family
VRPTSVKRESDKFIRRSGLPSRPAQLGAVQIAAYVAAGIGFLGAGVIMKDGAQISGLNTAATLWCSAAVGALSGIGLAAEAMVLTVAVLASNTLLRPLVNAINRAPINERQSEAVYEVHVVTGPETVGEVRDLLAEVLEKASYPIRQIEVVERSPEARQKRCRQRPPNFLDHPCTVIHRCADQNSRRCTNASKWRRRTRTGTSRDHRADREIEMSSDHQ